MQHQLNTITYVKLLLRMSIMVSLSLLGFKLLSGQGFYVEGHCDIDFWHFDPKINRDHLWVMAIHDTKNGKPRWNKFEIKWANKTLLTPDRQTDRQKDDMRHNIIWPKVHSGV